MKGGDGHWYDQMYIVRHVALDDRIRDYYVWARAQVPPRARLLDVGCGEGTFVAYASRHGFDAVGIDLSPTAVEAGRCHFGTTALHTTTLARFRTAHPGATFEAVTLFEIIEHVEAPVGFLREVYELLAPGGLVVLTVPNRTRWPIRDFVDYPQHHLTRWSALSLRALLETAGLEVLTIERSGVLLSIHFLFGYAFRVLLYKTLAMHAKGFAGVTPPAGLPRALLGTLGQAGSLLRRTRDWAMWVPTLALTPLLYPFFEGHNLMAVGRRSG